MKQTITVTEADYPTSIYSTIEWEQSVKITNWTHDYEKKLYIINFTI